MSKSFLELSHEERHDILPVLIGILKHRKTASKVFSNPEIRELLIEFGYEVSDAQIRKLVYHIRNNNLISLLLANTNGYYIGTRIEDVRNLIKMQQGKINAMTETLSSIEQQLELKRKELLSGNSDSISGQITIFDIE
jgi:hypothetical protein